MSTSIPIAIQLQFTAGAGGNFSKLVRGFKDKALQFGVPGKEICQDLRDTRCAPSLDDVDALDNPIYKLAYHPQIGLPNQIGYQRAQLGPDYT